MEGMEKQTAVEWLNSEVERLTTKAGIHLSWEMMDSIIRQAKQMEKEQILDAYIMGVKGKTIAEFNETFKSEWNMNIRKNSAGFVTKKHILKRGFKVFDIIEGFDYCVPQYQNDKIQIIGGYWNYVVKDIKTGNKLWEGWWNSNDEFDKTISELNNENENEAKGRLD